jgi:hypothetical protein
LLSDYFHNVINQNEWYGHSVFGHPFIFLVMFRHDFIEIKWLTTAWVSHNITDLQISFPGLYWPLAFLGNLVAICQLLDGRHRRYSRR